MANMDIVAFLNARNDAVGLDDIADLIAQGPPARAEAEIDRFWAWVEDPSPRAETFSLVAAIHHLETFWEARHRPNVVLLHYDDLHADLEGEMRRLADRLGIAVPEDRWPELAGAATFDRMRGRAAEVAPEVTKALWLDNDQFFHRGTSGQWRALLDENDLRRYAAAVAKACGPELAAWIHRGPLTGS